MGRMSFDELWKVVSAIPRGTCASYGDVGRALTNPTSGYQVGRWMASCPEDVPWWRVVAKDGHLPVGKKDPVSENEQTRLLEAEGVSFVEGRVDMERHRYVP